MIPVSRVAPEVQRVTKVHRVDGAERFHAWIISPLPWWVPFHWVDGGSVPHYDAPDRCSMCDLEHIVQVRGYLLVSEGRGHKPVFLEVTAFAWEEVKELLPDPANLRGFQILAKRERPNKNAPLQLKFHPDERSDMGSLEDEDPRPTLLTLWKKRPQAHRRRVNK